MRKYRKNPNVLTAKKCKYDSMINYQEEKARDEEPYIKTIDFFDKTVIDVGANMGYYSSLALRLGAAEVDAIEISDPIREKGGQMVPEAFWYKEIPDKKYDIALMLNVLDHLIRDDKEKDALALIAKCKKVVLTTGKPAHRMILLLMEGKINYQIEHQKLIPRNYLGYSTKREYLVLNILP